MDKQTGSFAVKCDKDFNLIKVIRDDNALFHNCELGKTLLQIIDKNSLQKSFNFCKEVTLHKAAFNWELNVKKHQKLFTFFFTGVWDKDVIVIGTEEPQQIMDFYQNYVQLHKEQLNSPSEKEFTASQKISEDANFFDELTSLNNELTDIYRELSKKNVLLKKKQEYLQLINRILRHDLANFFSVINSAANIYLRESEQKYIRAIKDYVSKGISLIQTMKKVELLFSEKIKLEKIDLSTVIEKVMEDYPEIDFKLDLGTQEVLADDVLKIVIDNLVRNAVQHGRTNRIDFLAEEDKNKIILKVKDNGIGIPNNIKDKIFEEGEFFGESGNTGLGLFIAQKALANYGGKIFVEDNYPKGSVFVLEFPK